MLPRFCLLSILSRELIGWNSSSRSKWVGARCKDNARVNISTTPVLLSSLAIAVLLLSSNNGGRKKYPEQPGRANSTNRLMSIGISSFTTTATARTKRPSELRASHGNLWVRKDSENIPPHPPLDLIVHQDNAPVFVNHWCHCTKAAPLVIVSSHGNNAQRLVTAYCDNPA